MPFKSKKKNKINNLTDILPKHIIRDFSNSSFEERKTKIKEASEFVKQKIVYEY